MTRLLLALPAFVLAAACATSQRPYAPVQDVRYQAAGTEPFWLLAIGDNRIVLRIANEGERDWPRTLPMTDGNVRQWRSGSGADNIVIDVRQTPTPCENGGRAFEDFVRVTIGERFYEGCGGRLVRLERGQ